MTGPRRIQRKRTQGWRAPDGAVSVTSPSKFGNPITAKMIQSQHRQRFMVTNDEAQRIATESFDEWLNGSTEWVDDPARRQRILDSLHELRGKTLMCFCAEGDPCHADVLLKRANAGGAPR